MRSSPGYRGIHKGRWSCVVSPVMVVIIAVGPSSAVAGQLKLYWSVLQDTMIRRSNLDGTQIEDILRTPGGIQPHVAVDTLRQHLYWPSPVANGIQRAAFDGSNVETVIRGISLPTHVAIDSMNQKAYWVDHFENTSIWRSNLDGTDREMLVPYAPRGIVEVDPANGYYYWSEFLDGTIHRTSLDNSETSVIYDASTFGRAGLPRGFTIDSENDYLYITDAVFQAVIRMRLDGSEPDLWITDGVYNPHGIAIDTVNERVYWSNDRTPGGGPISPNISSVRFDGTDQRIDFIPERKFGDLALVPGIVRHLEIVEIPVPEPAAATLVGIGGFLLFAGRRAPRYERPKLSQRAQISEAEVHGKSRDDIKQVEQKETEETEVCKSLKSNREPSDRREKARKETKQGREAGVPILRLLCLLVASQPGLFSV